MAAVTFTASEATVAVKNLPGVVLTKTSLLTLSSGGSASSIYLLCKVPHNAVILDFLFFVNSASGTFTSTASGTLLGIWQLGISQPEGSASNTTTYSALRVAASATAFGGTMFRPLGFNLPYRVNISTESLQRWAWITADPSLSGSASIVMRFTVKYTMDGV